MHGIEWTKLTESSVNPFRKENDKRSGKEIKPLRYSDKAILEKKSKRGKVGERHKTGRQEIEFFKSGQPTVQSTVQFSLYDSQHTEAWENN